MVENKKVLLEKVDIVRNMVDSLKKYMRTKKFWGKEEMVIPSLSW